MASVFSRFSWRRWCGGALLLAPLLGWAQADPPARVAYVSALEGAAQIATDGRHLQPAGLNWPVSTGTRLLVDPGTRAELQGGWTAARLAGPADLSITRLDDDTTQLALTDGSLSLRVRQLQPGERIEIDTPQLAVVAQQPGEYRVDVDPRGNTTRLTVHAGSATVYGGTGQSAGVGNRQQVTFVGRDLLVTQAAPALRDGFDQWVATRDALEERSRSAQYLPRDVPGYAQLDAWGEWAQDATYGSVWYPTRTVADWAPYRYGRWAWVEPWGWTWVDDAPWGFAPSHYGRWTQIGPRWAWVPGRFGPRPVYAPALVAFVGGGSGSGSLSWGVSLGSGAPAAAWFPLAPGEPWTPHYHASDRYRRGLNWGDGRERVHPPPDSYFFQRRPGAISVAPVDHFGGGGDRGRRPHFGDGSRLPPGALAEGRVVAPPPRAYVPGLATQAPLPPPRPGGTVMPSPRPPPGAGVDRDFPPPGVHPPRPGDGAQRPDRPIPPRAPGLPGDDRRERDRWLRDPGPRSGLPPPTPVTPPDATAREQQLQRQLQQRQEALVRERQQREAQQPLPMQALPPVARPPQPPPMEQAPRVFERAAPPWRAPPPSEGRGMPPPPRTPPVFESRPMPPREPGTFAPREQRVREPQPRQREFEPHERRERAPARISPEGMGG